MHWDDNVGYFPFPFTSCGVILLLVFGFVNEQKLILLHQFFTNAAGNILLGFNSSPCFSHVWNRIALKIMLWREFTTSTRRVAAPIASFNVLDAKYTEFLLLSFAFCSFPLYDRVT